MGTRETEFTTYRPKFTGKQAAKFFSDHGGEVVSCDGRHGAPDSYVVVFATRSEVLGPIALNPVVVEVLWREFGRHLKKLGIQ